MSYKKRKIEITIGGQTFIAPSTGYNNSKSSLNGQLDTRQFKIVFNIAIEMGNMHSYCDCSIYNLSKETEAKAFRSGVEFGIKAGYEDTIDFIFKGSIRNVFKERDGANTVTRIIAKGGGQPDSTINRTLGKNSTVVDAINACAEVMGYPVIIQSDDFANVNRYSRGYSLSGNPVVYLDNLAQMHGFKWTLDNERIVVVRNSSYRNGQPYVVSEQTGMEGIPELTETGCDVSIRMQPKIKIGGRIDIQSNLRTFEFSNVYFQNIPANAGSGVYRVDKIEHSGDTWGDDWTTKITGNRFL